MFAFKRLLVVPKRNFVSPKTIDPKETKKPEGFQYLLSSPYNWLPLATAGFTLAALWYYWPSIERKHHKEIEVKKDKVPSK